MDPRLLLALRFAAKKHTNQRRKGGHDVPYINHPIDVATLLATVGGVTDIDILSAAFLHDTVEDTDTTLKELQREFGRTVSALVAEVTDDPALTSAERKLRQEEEAPFRSPAAKAIRLADKICNVRDITDNPPPTWSRERQMEYFDWAERVVAGLRGTNAALEAAFDESIARARTIV
jgi:GTP diphosphokinase / guanosine-3',5'-bis(diphosphate) 3'-diphosphatase